MKKIFKAFFTVTSISVATRAISFVFKIFVSRKLGAEIMGVYQICFSVFMLLVSLPASGLPVTLSRLTAETQATGDIRSQRSAVTTCLLISLMLSMTACTFFYSFPSLLGYIFTDERCVKLFLIILPTMITTSVYTITRSWMWGRKKFFVFSATEAADEIIKIVICCVLIIAFGNAVRLEYTLAYAILASDCIVAVVLVAAFFKEGGRLGMPAMYKPIVRSAAPLTVTRVCGSVMTTFISLILPTILITSCNLTSSEATAEFGRASGMVMPLLLAPASIIGSLSVVIIPEIASKHAEGNKGLLSSVKKSLNFTCAVSCAAFVLFFGCGRQIGTMLYADSLVGRQLAFAAHIVIPLSLGGITVSVLNSLGKENKTFLSYVAGYIVLAASILLLPRFMGIYGYYTAYFIFHCVTLLINTVFLHKEITAPAVDYLRPVTLIITSAAIAFIIRIISSAVSSTGNLITCLICLPVAALLYLLALRVTGYMPKPSMLIGYIRK